MPLCPQITNTPITVTQTADFTVSSVIPVVAATTTAVNAAKTAADAALADAAIALAEANDAYAAAIGSLQPSANTIVNTSNQITAINGNGITVYAGSSPTSGARVVLNSAGLAGFNAGGGATFSVSASTGAAVFSGDVTGSTITGGSLNIAGNAIINSSGFLTATGANITGTITATSGSFTGSLYSSNGLIGGFYIGSTYLSSGAGGTGFFINSSTGGASFASVSASGTGSFASVTSSGSISAGGGTFVINGGTSTISGGSYTVNNLGAMTAASLTTNNNITANGDMTSVGELRAQFGANNTVTSAASTWMSTTGQLRRVGPSSRRYKTDIVALTDVSELDPKALLTLPVRAFRYKPEHLSANDDRSEMLIPGFIAEEVDAIYPIAADYENGAETWNDRIMIPALLSLIQNQEKRIKELENK